MVNFVAFAAFFISLKGLDTEKGYVLGKNRSTPSMRKSERTRLDCRWRVQYASRRNSFEIGYPPANPEVRFPVSVVSAPAAAADVFIYRVLLCSGPCSLSSDWSDKDLTTCLSPSLNSNRLPAMKTRNTSCTCSVPLQNPPSSSLPVVATVFLLRVI